MTELPWASPHRGGVGGAGGGRQPELGAGMGQGGQGNAVFTLTPRDGPGLGKTPRLREISALPFLAVSSWLSHTASLLVTSFSAPE